jgi:bacteriocin biosynthesis cyclodehydratase domain-containing protein
VTAELPSLHVSPAWRVHRLEERLYLSAGLDATYLLDELDGAAADSFAQAWQQDALASWPAAAQHAPLIEKLRLLGAVYVPRTSMPLPQRVGLRWAGQACQPYRQALESLLADHGPPGWQLAPPGDDTDGHALTLVVRTTATLLQTSELAASLHGPHLLVDMAHHETVVIGPFVVRGETACLGCLAGRMNRLWGDPEPAPQPAMLARAALVAALTAEHLATFAQRRSIPALVQHAWSLSLGTWEARLHPVFLLPWCPVCSPAPPHPSGRIDF